MTFNERIERAARVVIAAVLACFAATPAQAQPYPSKPVRFIIPYPAGSSSNDIFGRVLAQRLSDAFGQQFVVDNRAGASGHIGSETAARAAPDGYTLLLGTNGSVAISPSVYPKLAYDPLKDLAPVTLFGIVPYIMVVHASVPANSVQEFIALAKAKPGQLRFASSGVAGTPHLCGEMLKALARIDMLHVPYKGGAPATIDLIGGHVQAYFSGIPAQLPHVRAGRIRALAITTLKRSASMPELPTFDESGVPGYDANSWMGVFAPARTPRALIERVHAQIEAVMKSPEMREAMIAQGVEPAALGPQAFAASIRADVDKYAKLIKEAGIRLD
jgi:tripartite-type tricarboxylate transporter receptor subunit TctC